jgi:hypothetical protein
MKNNGIDMSLTDCFNYQIGTTYEIEKTIISKANSNQLDP